MAQAVKRVKTGCVTCRIRRVKCDESRPSCKKCTCTGRVCDGYSTLTFSRRELAAASQVLAAGRDTSTTRPNEFGLLPRLIADATFSDVLEKRYFQFFRQRTVTSTNSLVDARFWDRILLQSAHREPAVKHAVLALSSWHQHSEPDLDNDTRQKHRLYSEQQHQKALVEAQALLASAGPQTSPDVVLIACIVFICFEAARANFEGSQVHMHSGRSILVQNRKQLQAKYRRSDLVEIEQALFRLDIHALSFQSSAAPLKYSLGDFLETNPILEVPDFTTFAEARACLIDLSRWTLVSTNIEPDMGYLKDHNSIERHEEQKVKCRIQMQRWKERFDILEADLDRSSPVPTHCVQIWWAAIMAIIESSPHGPETRWDKAQHRFKSVVEIGEMIVQNLISEGSKSSFSLDIGYVDAVFLVASRCRDPYIRRRALAVLRACRRREGQWDSAAAAAVAESFMDVEEEGLGIVTKASDIPESKRVQCIDPELHAEQECADVRFVIMPTQRSELVFVHKHVRWDSAVGGYWSS